jgi:hypothetical protein
MVHFMYLSLSLMWCAAVCRRIICRRHDPKNQNYLKFVGTLFVGELCHSGVLRSSLTCLWCAVVIVDKLKQLNSAKVGEGTSGNCLSSLISNPSLW